MFQKLLKRIRALKKSEDGMTTWEVAIACLTFIIVFAAAVDVILLSNAHITATTVAKDLARTMSVQGGAWSNKPEGYTENYYTLAQLQNLVAEELEHAGMEENWAVYIKDHDEGEYYPDPLLTKTETAQYTADYMESFSVKIVATYKWRILGNQLGAPIQSTISVTMPGLSEWKYDYGEWEGA